MRGVLRRLSTRYRILGVACGLVTLFLAGACDIADRGPSGPDSNTPALAAQQAGQGNESQGRSDAARGDFYPLEIGNQWTYSGEISLETMLYETGVTDSSVVYIEEDHTLIGKETLFGRDYVLEMQEQRDQSTGDLVISWIRYRQDGAGLYEADVPTGRPPAATRERVALANAKVIERRRAALRRQVSSNAAAENRAAFDRAWAELAIKLNALDVFRGRGSVQSSTQGGPPGGVLTDEITRLRYPLRPGQEWAVRDVPSFGATVEGRDVLDLPSGKMSCSRIRFRTPTTPGQGPADLIIAWYGRNGFVGISIQIETWLLDPTGPSIGVLIYKEKVFLDSINLVRPGRF